MKRIIFLTAVLCVMWISSAYAKDDFQYWSRFSVEPLRTEHFSYKSFWEMRYKDDAGDLALWYGSQRFSWTAHDFATFGLNYTYLQSEADLSLAKGDEWKYQHRLELEYRPRLRMTDRWSLANRNRMEFRWIEDKGSDQGRFRQKWDLIYKTNHQYLKSTYMNTEYFYDFNQRKVNELRTTPIGVNFSLNKNVQIGLFYMIRSLKGGDSWSSEQIVGTQFNWSRTA